MSRPNMTVRTKGTLMGIKINTTGSDLRILRKTMDRKTIVRDMKKLFRKRLKGRIPVLREQLVEGLGGYVGTKEFESTVHGSHKPHYDIPNPWSLLMGDRVLLVRMDRGTGDLINVSASFSTRRIARINFHWNMSGKVPRADFIAQRFDDTCLPFIKDGHFGRIFGEWGENNRIGFEWAIELYMRDAKKALYGDDNGAPSI